MPLSLATGVQYVKGVGPRLATLLASRGIFTVEDLLYTLPFRYEDRSQLRPIQSLLEGESATIVAQVQTVSLTRTRRGLSLLTLVVGDGSATLRCIWYNADFLKDRFQSGQTLALFGRLERDQGRRVLRQPEFEILPAEPADAAPAGAGLGGSLRLGRIVPVYESIGTLSSGWLRRFIHRALEETGELPELLPVDLRQRLALPDRRAALEQVHFPGPGTSIEDLAHGRSPGHRRLILEELFHLQCGLELKRRRVKRQPGALMALDARVRERLKKVLPFHPTEDQKQVLREIAADLRSGQPMRRLLQGDVGSGKTIVALQAAAIAIENGYQVAFMAPTQILAEQHFLYARQRLPEYRVMLVTSAERRRRPAAFAPQLAIGTQALLQEGVRWNRLGLVIVDEQHRFGVMQRFQLMHQGETPAHLLVMTATPIPRTLALALYGDLDTSVIRHSPPGSPPILTRLVPAQRSAEVYEFVRKHLAAGRQAYFVYPLVEESEALDLKPALGMFEHLRGLYPEFAVGLLHGRMPPVEKQAVMAAFRAGELRALVSTSVIEVGVDVPNATLMVIEHAERFGIAQLHQLRGRVGRPQPKSAAGASLRSYCFLLHGEDCGEVARRRLEAVAATRDGFVLAEADLQLRGAGEFFGTRQSGVPSFRVAQPLRDLELIEVARTEARGFLERASPEELRRLVQQIRERWQRRYGLVEVG